MSASPWRDNLIPGKTPHGTNSRYARGCRCDECRKASSDYHRARRLQRVADAKTGWVPVPHGANAYTNFGCRCQVCVTAARAAEAALKIRRST